MIDRFYKEIITAKDGTQIPVIFNGKTIESRYNPVLEAERLFSSLTFSPETSFYLFIGCGRGSLIQKIHCFNPYAFILILENSREDINFLTSHFLELNNNNINFVTINEIGQKLLNYYIPAFYGNIQIIENKAWCNENAELYQMSRTVIDAALKNISADYSVQSHFGKIWHKNIIRNYKFAEHLRIKNSDKIAYIVAAGASLDFTIRELKETNDKIIIATDTAFHILNEYKIFPDYVISIDGQIISSTHFLVKNSTEKECSYIFDFCSPSNVISKLKNKNSKVYLSETGHPLSKYLNHKAAPSLQSGSGTVTIAALDFAINAGFKDIRILGADFAYLNNKPYAKGSYLDINSSIKATKVAPVEQFYTKLMFRTELVKNNENELTTTTLDSYKSSMEQFLIEKNCSFNKKNHIYYIKNSNINIYNTEDKIIDKNSPNLEFLYKNLSKNHKINTIFDLTREEISLLPLISWLRKYDNKKENFEYFLNKAKQITQDLL